MAEIKQLFQAQSVPGIRRDGTGLDGSEYYDGQWVRFQRGRPKKMGGYQQISDQLSGPIRDCLVWSREAMNAVYTFSSYGIEMLLVDNNGLGSSITVRTPAGFTSDTNIMWSIDTQYDDAVGSQGTVVLAHASLSLDQIDSVVTSKPYLGLANGSGVFTQIADAPAVSGGIFSTAPYTICYGSDGFVSWSDANQPQVWSTTVGVPIGDAGADRVTGAKIVKGLSLRSGSGPAALLWSLDSVIRMDYVGGQAIFKFTTLSAQSSILSQNSVIEYDGAYFWVGIDRFLVCDGGKVNELPNQMNLNWFFDNLNYEERQKVWAMKIPRYGEVWWFYPRGLATECTHAVIFNVRENTWYDVELPRSAGFYSQVFRFPVMVASNASTIKVALALSGVIGTISVGDKLVGTTSRSIGQVVTIIGSVYYLELISGVSEFIVAEGISDTTSGATATVAVVQEVYSAYLHEKGTDSVVGDNVTAIPSFFETADFGLPTGGSQPNQISGTNRWTRLVRIEPDFIQTGTMTVEVTGKEFANAPEDVSSGYNFTSSTEKIDMREQRREIRLKFTSNEVGGHYEMGRVIIHTEPGDVRS